MKRSIFEGSAAAVVTPMDEYGNLDLDAMGRLLDWLLEEKTDAIVVNRSLIHISEPTRH